jgi:alkyl sulfatase BDS1-like metallo-beta-lactamase superfamily hydrolase
MRRFSYSKSCSQGATIDFPARETSRSAKSEVIAVRTNLRGIHFTLQFVFHCLLAGACAAAAAEVGMNPELSAYIEAIGKPRLEKLTERVYVARAYGGANFLFIIGDGGVIAIDSSWHVGSAAQALTDLRKITDKPITTVIYSHGHPDHTGGVRAFIPEGAEDRIPIYASAKWHRYQDELITPIQPMILRRGAKQFDLDRVFDGDIMVSLGRFPAEGAVVSYLPPTREIDGPTELTIEGVRFEFEPHATDLDDALLIRLPDENVVYAGDAVTDMLPFIETPRMETGRSAEGFVTAPGIIAGWKPDHLVMGHGNTIIGDPDRIQRILRVQRDAVRSIIDQTTFYMNQGRTRDETADLVRLPPHLANEPTLREHYHRLSWMVKSIYTRHAGWYGDDAVEMIRHGPDAEAMRMVALAGGARAMRMRAEAALEDGDDAWAAQLATYLIQAGLEKDHALQIKIKAFRKLAATTPSSNERDYLSAEAKMLEGTYRPGGESRILSIDIARRATPKVLVELLSAKFDATRAFEDRIVVNLHFTEANETFSVEIDRGILHRNPGAAPDAATTVHVGKLDFISVLLGQKRYRDASFSVDGDPESALRLFDRLGL